MIRRTLLALAAACLLAAPGASTASADEMAYGTNWGGHYNRNWDRFYHYPYVYYPQNYWGHEYYQSSNSLYYRYPPEMRVPVYNKWWHSEYPKDRRYHWGHHFVLDVF